MHLCCITGLNFQATTEPKGLNKYLAEAEEEDEQESSSSDDVEISSVVPAKKPRVIKSPITQQARSDSVVDFLYPKFFKDKDSAAVVHALFLCAPGITLSITHPSTSFNLVVTYTIEPPTDEDIDELPPQLIDALNWGVNFNSISARKTISFSVPAPPGTGKLLSHSSNGWKVISFLPPEIAIVTL